MDSQLPWLDPRFAQALGVDPRATESELLEWLGGLNLNLHLENSSCRTLFLEILRTAQDVLVTYGPTVDIVPDRSVPGGPSPVSADSAMALHTIANLAILRVGFDVRDTAYRHPGVRDAIPLLISNHLTPLTIEAGLFTLIGGAIRLSADDTGVL